MGMKKREGKRIAPRFLTCKTGWMVVISERGPACFGRMGWEGVHEFILVILDLMGG